MRSSHNRYLGEIKDGEIKIAQFGDSYVLGGTHMLKEAKRKNSKILIIRINFSKIKPILKLKNVQA